MASARRLLLSLFSVLVCAVGAEAQCPPIPNLRITHATTSYTIAWDAPADIANPTYEIMQTSGALYCPMPAAGTASVIGTTTQRTFTVQKTSPETAYYVHVRVQSNPCSTSGGRPADTFSQPPPQPTGLTASAPGNVPTISFSYAGERTTSLWLYNVDQQQFITAIGGCGPNPKQISDTQARPAGTHRYRVIAYNTGNATGLGGVGSDVINVVVGQQPATPPRVAFGASPSTVRAGQAATLSWRVSGASSVVIDQGPGTQPLSGSVSVSPAVTTTYTLTAMAGNQVTKSSVTVTVNTVPEVAISASPSPLVQQPGAGGATTTYVVTNAGGGATTISLTQSSDFFTQSPTQFTLQPGASQSVTVTGVARAAGAYAGSISLQGAGVPEGLRVGVRMLVVSPPSEQVEARPARNRIDVYDRENGPPAGEVTFSNSGPGTLVGILVSNVPWINPQEGLVSIPPGESRSFGFTIDRLRRPEGSAAIGSLRGNVALVYLRRVGASGAVRDEETTTPSVSLVTVVDTVKLSSAPGAPPPIAPNEVALFIPGVGHVQGSVGLFISDLSVLNPSGNQRLDDLRFYYTPLTGVAGGVQKTAAVPPIPASGGVAFGDVVQSVFASTGQVGSLMLRSASADKLSVSTTVFNSSNPAGTYGTAIPVLRSDRAAAAGSQVVLTGLRSDEITHTNVYLQETSGANTTIDTEFLDADGAVVGTRSDSLGPFAVLQANAVVPAGAVSAIMTNRAGSTGCFLSFATPVDKRSGDTWAVADWSRQYGYASADPVVIPVAGTLRGANNSFFRTDVAIMNTGTGASTVTLRFVSPAAGSVERQVTIDSNRTSLLPDVIGSLFALDGVSGYLVITPGSGTIAINSRTYATVGDNPATYGTHVPALATAAALKLGDLRSFGALEDAAVSTVVERRPGSFRTNVGLLETAGKAASVRVTMRFSYPAGSKVEAVGTAAKVYDLAPGQFLQVNAISGDILGSSRDTLGDLRNLTLDFQVVSGEGEVTIFTSSTDNGTADSILRTE